MPRIEIPIGACTRAGTMMPDPLPGDVLNGHAFPNDGRVGLIVRNTSVDTVHNVTINLSRTVDGQTVMPRVEPVAIGQALAFGPFSPGDYGTSVAINVDSAALTLMAVRVA
ncbi:hypothetical protein ACIP6P_00770 [Streptomyces sp. NPDC088729]|uniref:hypothetical protein n=1 Tax=Streptomyces sp. NPDC088729 TaxID=3365876 RepID=UPI0037FDA76C